MRAGVAFGSNLGDRLAALCAARAAVCGLEGVSGPFRQSSVYETEPVGTDAAAAPFLNAVLELEYAGRPTTLLDALQSIEQQMGRPSKRPRNSDRVIDLDLLYAGNIVLQSEHVVIPHPRLHLRRFVLTPLAEIRPELVLPGREVSIAALLAGLADDAEVEKAREQWEALG